MSANPLELNEIPLRKNQYGPWFDNLRALSAAYRANEPVPHIWLTKFLDPHLALRMAQEFPSADAHSWTRYQHYNESKFGLTDWKLFPPSLQEAVVLLNSPFFVSQLSKLTGIPDLLPDSSLEGGGLHCCRRGGYLNLHSDFSRHHYNRHWRRRVNLILYLNPCWNENWGGAIEFWDRATRKCVVKYPPCLNHAVIFDTEGSALHGFPDPLTCPFGVSRNSVALYYYTLDGNSGRALPTDYYARPSDGTAKKIFVWLDKKVISLYSRAKARFKFSDKLASRVLGLFSRK